MTQPSLENHLSAWVICRAVWARRGCRLRIDRHCTRPAATPDSRHVPQGKRQVRAVISLWNIDCQTRRAADRHKWCRRMWRGSDTSQWTPGYATALYVRVDYLVMHEMDPLVRAWTLKQGAREKIMMSGWNIFNIVLLGSCSS